MKPTKLLYLEDSYQKTADAKIVNITDNQSKKKIILDSTIFYPIGGGQPNDIGTIVGETGTLRVTSVRYHDGLVEHSGKIEGTFEVGQKVTLEIDWNIRYKNMQVHTAGHLIDEAVKSIEPEFRGIDGMHGINNEQYIEYKGFLNSTIKEEVETWITTANKSDMAIVDEMVSRDDIAKLHILLPYELPSNKPLRLIRIGDYDPVPDGGTQLKNTKELWPIKVGEFEYKDGNTRIHYDVPSPDSNQKTIEIAKPSIKDTISIEEFKKQLGDTKDKPFKEIARLILRLSPPDRKEGGKLLNELKKELESASDKRKISQEETWFDITLPGIEPIQGHTHLITQAIKEIEDIFARLGFVRRRYPEIESDWYYAEGLNIPKGHPARDDQETFYLSDNVVLTAHTSNGQLREMEFLKNPPIKMINIGKTYRRQASNTHSPMFHQFEGLLIDKNITMAHLVGVSNYFAKNYFGPDREIRLRPHHFQFTEPSFEVDINCHLCKGTGMIDGHKCKVCKSGWLELGGAGMVHPNVLKNGGIDPNSYSGFAFGWGVERVIFMKHQVTDNLRELYTQDLRFLQQG
jgi:phenylalanyl-tRNA synthetase alpha chain